MMDDFGNDMDEVAPYQAFAAFVRHVISDQEDVHLQFSELELQYWLEA